MNFYPSQDSIKFLPSHRESTILMLNLIVSCVRHSWPNLEYGLYYSHRHAYKEHYFWRHLFTLFCLIHQCPPVYHRKKLKVESQSNKIKKNYIFKTMIKIFIINMKLNTFFTMKSIMRMYHAWTLYYLEPTVPHSYILIILNFLGFL